VWISPTGATVSTDKSQQFDAVVSGNSNTASTRLPPLFPVLEP
jgi:hypothetical protein